MANRISWRATAYGRPREHHLRNSICIFGWLTCTCCSSSTSPSTYPDLSGSWSGHVSISLALPGAPPVSTTCIHQWTIGSSAGGQITGSWQSTPDVDLVVIPACQQSGSLTGTISPSGAITLSFNAILGVTSCTPVGGNDVVSGSEAVGAITASGQDTINCPGFPSEHRSLSFSLLKQ